MVRVRVNVTSSGESIVPRGVVRVRVNVTSSGESSRLYHMEWSGLGLMLRCQVSRVDCTTWSGQG